MGAGGAGLRRAAIRLPAGVGQLTHLRAHVARSALDAELAALVWLLVERGVPLVVGSPDRAAAEDLRAAFMAAVIERQPGRDSLAGGVVVAASLESVLSRLGASSELPDEARDLGLVLIVSDARVTIAHYVRPVERDAAGHLQRRPPAVLSARDERGELDHFFWAVTDELATGAGMTREDLEDESAIRARWLSGEESGVGPPNARH